MLNDVTPLQTMHAVSLQQKFQLNWLHPNRIHHQHLQPPHLLIHCKLSPCVLFVEKEKFTCICFYRQAAKHAFVRPLASQLMTGEKVSYSKSRSRLGANFAKRRIALIINTSFNLTNELRRLLIYGITGKQIDFPWTSSGTKSQWQMDQLLFTPSTNPPRFNKSSTHGIQIHTQIKRCDCLFAFKW